MRTLRYALLPLLAIGVASCGDSGGPSDNGCDAPITITIDATTHPTFNWSPKCNVAEVRVTQPSEPDVTKQVKWQVVSDINTIGPPVSYGTVPAGAQQIKTPDLLVTGTQYLLVLSVRDATSGDLFVHAQQTFTP